MKNLLVRCSSLSKMMTNPRGKNEEISATTKSWLKEMVKEEFYGYKKKLDSPAITKGIDMEDVSIELLNDVIFADHKKNEKRITNDWLTGEADIVGISEILDVKTSWSLETFPAFQEDADAAVKKSGYDWQLRGYMILYNKPQASIRYCMIDTPDYLLKKWDDKKIHKVSHIQAKDRVSTVTIERDKEIEAKIKERYDIANKYYQKYWKEINNK